MKRILILSILIVFISQITIAWTGETIRTINTPGDFPTGLTYDGEHLWIADRKTEILYCINPSDGSIIKELKSPGYWPMGLAYDGNFLWNADVKGFATF